LFYDNIVHDFGEITHNKGHYAVQGQSVTNFGTNRKLVIRLPITD